MQNGENTASSYDFRKCIGLKVKPRKGDGLLFYSLYPNGTIDPVSKSKSTFLIFVYQLYNEVQYVKVLMVSDADVASWELSCNQRPEMGSNKMA